jgi:ketosteroid isomerase-like protein
MIIALMSFSVMAQQQNEEPADLYAAIQAFDHAYATNDTDTYFGYYDESATVFYSGDRQDLAAYAESWPKFMEAGGGVEKNVMSDLKVQVLPGGDVAISTAFVDNITRSPDGSKSAIRAFETDVWQKIDGEWKVISLHYTELPADE